MGAFSLSSTYDLLYKTDDQSPPVVILTFRNIVIITVILSTLIYFYGIAGLIVSFFTVVDLALTIFVLYVCFTTFKDAPTGFWVPRAITQQVKDQTTVIMFLFGIHTVTLLLLIWRLSTS
jgi:hypothetical protein